MTSARMSVRRGVRPVLLASVRRSSARDRCVFRPTGDVGYVEIKTVPIAPLTQAALYLDSSRLDPIRQGGACCGSRSAR